MIYKGEDKIIECLIVDEETGDPFDISTAAGILIFIYQYTDKIIEQYSFFDTVGYKKINFVTDGTDGKIFFEYLNDKSKLTNERYLIAEVKIKRVNDDFDSGFQNLVCKITIDLMSDCQTKNTDVPS